MQAGKWGQAAGDCMLLGLQQFVRAVQVLHLVVTLSPFTRCALLVQGSTGSMMGKRKLEIEVKTENGQIPDFTLSVSSTRKVS